MHCSIKSDLNSYGSQTKKLLNILNQFKGIVSIANYFMILFKMNDIAAFNKETELTKEGYILSFYIK